MQIQKSKEKVWQTLSCDFQICPVCKDSSPFDVYELNLTY